MPQDRPKNTLTYFSSERDMLCKENTGRATGKNFLNFNDHQFNDKKDPAKFKKKITCF